MLFYLQEALKIGLSAVAVVPVWMMGSAWSHVIYVESGCTHDVRACQMQSQFLMSLCVTSVQGSEAKKCSYLYSRMSWITLLCGFYAFVCDFQLCDFK